MASARNTKLVCHIDCAGGGQVWVDGTVLYIGHMQAPTGTTIIDISDPRAPRTLARIEMPQGWHSHKVRPANGIMIVNPEVAGKGHASVADRSHGIRLVGVAGSSARNGSSVKQ